jgi:uncharacterized protein DUF6496
MPERETIERAQEDAREGKSPSTQAGEFVREEMHHIREGKHGASSTKQAIAIGLSKARRAGVKLQSPAQGKVSAKTRKRAKRDSRMGQSHSHRRPSATRSRATSRALKKEGRSAASHRALSKQARSTARKRGAAARRASAMKAVRTKGLKGHRQISRKTQARRSH